MMSLLQSERNLSYVFQILARCPKTSDEAAKQRITDTLLYQHGSLRMWFYTDSDSGEVLKRDRREWSAERIIDVFSSDGASSPTAPLGVPVAFYVHYAAGRSVEHNRKLASADEDDNADVSSIERVIDLATKYCHQYGDDAEPLSVDYFDVDTLRAFLATRENKHNVILQKFVRGCQDHSSMVQMVWSPHRALTMQRQNNHSLHDTRVPLYQRTNTFDNTTHLSHEVRPTSVMSSRLDVECRQIASHIFAVEQRIVTRMVAFFSFDTHRHPVLLFVSEMQLTAQHATAESVRLGLSFVVKRKLCMVSPQIIPSDVVFPDYAKIHTFGGSGARKSAATQSIGIGSGESQLSLHVSKSTMVRHALHSAGAQTFDKQMRVLDETFDSAYEARHDRGALTVEQRRVLVATPAFSVRSAPAAAWDQFSEQRSKKQRSFLAVGKTFYVADPLKEKSGDRTKWSGASLALRDKQSDEPPPTRPASALSSGTIRCASAALNCLPKRAAGSPKREYTVVRPGSSLLLCSEVAYCRGGGGGLFMKKIASNGLSNAGDDSTLHEVSDAQSTSSFRHSHSFSQHTEDALAALRSPSHTPTKGPRSNPTAIIHAEGSADAPVRLADLVASPTASRLSGTHSFHDHSHSMASLPWSQWRSLLSEATRYRQMVQHTEEHAWRLACGDTAVNMDTDRQIAEADALRGAATDSWLDVELCNLTTCPPEQLCDLHVNAEPTERRRDASSIPMQRVNLWLLFHPTLFAKWGYASAELHRRALDSIEELLVEVENEYLATQVAIGGAPYCDFKFEFSTSLQGMPPEWCARLHSTLPQQKAAHGGCQSLASIPWQVTAWLLWGVLQPSTPLPQPQHAAAGDTSAFLHHTNEHHISVPIKAVTPAMSAETLLHSLKVLTATQNPSYSVQVAFKSDGTAPSLRFEVALRRVTAEKQTKIRAAVRSLCATLSSSWKYNALTCLDVILKGCDSTRDISQVASSEKDRHTVHSRKKKTAPPPIVQQSTAMSDRVMPPSLFSLAPEETSNEPLLLTAAEWSTLRQTVVAARDALAAQTVSSSFEWPPRMTFVN